MKIQSLIVFTCFLLSAGIIYSAETQDRDRQSEKTYSALGSNTTARGLAESLGLDNQTRQRIRSQMYNIRNEMISLRAERDKARNSLNHLLQSEEYDEKLIMQAANELIKANGAIIRSRVKSRIKVHNMLTPEQREQFEQIRERARTKFNRRKTTGDRNKNQRGYKQGAGIDL
jgi:Spy/CpxP family protein refolding chaperone